MKTSDHLREARARIERGWCKRDRAIDYRGISTSPSSSSAVAWCAIGACEINAGSYLYLRNSLPGGHTSTVAYNDALFTTKQDILDLYDRAIKLAETDEQ